MAQFYAMCGQLDLESDEEGEAVRDLQEAVAQTFNMTYGTRLDDLSAWRKLYKALYDGPIPNKLGVCRDVSTFLCTTLLVYDADLHHAST